MADTTPQKQQASARLLQVGVDEESLDGSSYPAGVSRTPGSPTKQGGRTMWTKADDDDVVNGSSAVGASDANGVSETELVIKQVTHTDTLTAPVYGTSAQPTSFKRKGGGLDGRGAGAPSGGRGGGLFGAFMCCIPARKEDRNNQRYTTPTSVLGAHRTTPEARAMHTGEPFLPPREASQDEKPKPCLVLDLDETLVHSSFKPVPNPDFVISVEIDGAATDVYVLKRPWVDYFMEEVSKHYEIVVFTASLAKYADPLLDLLDKTKCIKHRLFRESCYLYQGNYVKDLTSLGRPMESVVIVDNSPHSYAFQPQNALPVRSFIDDKKDTDLLDMLPYLEELARVPDVVETLVRNQGFVPRRSFQSRGIPAPRERHDGEHEEQRGR